MVQRPSERSGRHTRSLRGLVATYLHEIATNGKPLPKLSAPAPAPAPEPAKS
jgi:hypothetical protein